MKKMKAALLAALIVGSFAATTNIKADAQRVIVTPGYRLGYPYGWRRHYFYRTYPWYGYNRVYPRYGYNNWGWRGGFWRRGWH
jgi:hypothetical protein